MALEFQTFDDLRAHGFDTVIDVRSPAEFAEDHIPGAINLPALSNAERAEVGTIYKQVSAFDARKIGAAMVARNVADHLAGPLADKTGGWRPLVYCWRGGQRSGSFASILSQIGWRAETVKGGYQSYRRLVHDVMYARPLDHRIVLLDGNTGTAKTEILQRLDALHVQVLDLEGAARHRGSLLGAQPGGQPSQKAFESTLAAALQVADPQRVTVIEAESSKIGRLNLPQSLWQRMMAAPRIVISAPIEARAAYLRQAYAQVAADTVGLQQQLDVLRPLRGHVVVERWRALIDRGDMTGLARALMEDHYDPSYARSRKEDSREVLDRLALAALDGPVLDQAAAQIAGLVNAL